MKHPSLRVASCVDFHSSVLDELTDLFKGVIEIIGMTPTDIEICGSSANASADLSSDIDVAYPMKDWNEQMELRRLFFTNMKIQEAVDDLLVAYRDKYQVKIDFNPVIPDNKASNRYATYSLFERRLYGTPIDLRAQYLTLSPYTQFYVLRQYEKNGVEVASKMDIRVFAEPRYPSDPFIDEIPKWRKIYGDKFLECKQLPDGQLTDADRS